MKGFQLVYALLLLPLFGPPLCFAQTPIILPQQAVVVSSHPLATEAGKLMMKRGGNAFDAAIAVAAVLAVVAPYQNSLGAGAVWLLEDRRFVSTGHMTVINARERAPLSNPLATGNGLATAIPGEAAGIAYLALNYAKLSLRETLAPAIHLAEEGFIVDQPLVEHLSLHQEALSQYPSTRDIFLPAGNVPIVGTLLKQPDLANTFKRLAKEGQAGFYGRERGLSLVNENKKAGGTWSHEDLSAYQVSTSEPLTAAYHHLGIATVPPGVGGGLRLLNALNLLNDFDWLELSDADRKHLMIEAIKLSLCNRSVTGQERKEEWHKIISIKDANTSKMLGCVPFPIDSQTSNYLVLDQKGNRVAATVVMNAPFGTGFVLPGTGILLTKEVHDKKGLSAVLPTFVETAQGAGLLTARAGEDTLALVLLGILAAEKNALPKTWLLTPRFYPRLFPERVYFEPDAFLAPLQHALSLRGHSLQALDKPQGEMQVIFWNTKNGKVFDSTH